MFTLTSKKTSELHTTSPLLVNLWILYYHTVHTIFLLWTIAMLLLSWFGPPSHWCLMQCYYGLMVGYQARGQYRCHELGFKTSQSCPSMPETHSLPFWYHMHDFLQIWPVNWCPVNFCMQLSIIVTLISITWLHWGLLLLILQNTHSHPLTDLWNYVIGLFVFDVRAPHFTKFSCAPSGKLIRNSFVQALILLAQINMLSPITKPMLIALSFLKTPNYQIHIYTGDMDSD